MVFGPTPAKIKTFLAQPNCVVSVTMGCFPVAPLLCFGVSRSVLTPRCHRGQTSVCQRSLTPSHTYRLEWQAKSQCMVTLTVSLCCGDLAVLKYARASQIHQWALVPLSCNAQHASKQACAYAVKSVLYSKAAKQPAKHIQKDCSTNLSEG